jgi:hypothetical protein
MERARALNALFIMVIEGRGKSVLGFAHGRCIFMGWTLYLGGLVPCAHDRTGPDL